MKRLLLFLALLIASAASRGVRAQETCSPGGTVIFFGNGMRNDAVDALDSLIALQTLHTPSELDPEGRVAYELAYNSKEPIWLELLEVARQKAFDDPAGVWRFLSGEEPPDWFRELETKQAKQLGALIEFIIDEDLQRHVGEYLSRLLEGRRVLVVSHSQGNFYANSSFYLLPLPYVSRWGNVQVATPASSVASGGPWRTFADDLVMLAVRDTVGALPANLPAQGFGLPPSGDILGHNFIRAYLRSASSEIAAVMRSSAGALPAPAARPATCAPAERVPVPPRNAAVSLGDPHLCTFDGVRYDMQGVGELILTRDPADNFEIQVRTKPWRASRLVAVSVGVAARVGKDRVRLYLDGRVLINDGAPPLQNGKAVLPDGGQLFQLDRGAVLVWPDGSQLHVTLMGSYLDLRLYLADARKGHVQGLLGNLDGSTTAELVTRQGQVIDVPPTFADFYGKYVNSWRVDPLESLFDYTTNETTESFTNLLFPATVAYTEGLGADTFAAASRACQEASVPERWRAACILDVGLTDTDAFARGMTGAPEVKEDLAIAPPGGGTDDDSVPDERDNCPSQANPLQHDADANGRGDACETNVGPFHVTWTDWTSLTIARNGSGAGLIAAPGGDVVVTYAGDVGLGQTTGTNTLFSGTSFASVQVENTTPSRDYIGMLGGLTAPNVITFSKPVRDPYVAILSLGAPGAVRTYDFDQPFEVLSQGAGAWGGGKLTTRDGKVLEGAEGNGVIRFKGTFSTLSWTVPLSENWHGFAIGLGDSP